MPQTDRPDPRSSIVRLGVFELNLTTGELRKGGTRIRLQPQPAKVLAILLDRAGQLVTRDELQQQLWSEDTFVDFEHALNFAIKKLREALSDDADNPRFIETLPRRGYRYIGPIEWAPSVAADLSARAGAKSASAPAPPARVIPISQGAVLADAAGAPPSALPPARSTLPLFWPAVAAAILLALAAVLFRPTVPPPTVSRIRQLTHLGTVVHNTKILTDGPRVYFRAWQGRERAIFTVSPSGGDVFPIDRPFSFRK